MYADLVSTPLKLTVVIHSMERADVHHIPMFARMCSCTYVLEPCGDVSSVTQHSLLLPPKQLSSGSSVEKCCRGHAIVALHVMNCIGAAVSLRYSVVIRSSLRSTIDTCAPNTPLLFMLCEVTACRQLMQTRKCSVTGSCGIVNNAMIDRLSLQQSVVHNAASYAFSKAASNSLQHGAQASLSAPTKLLTQTAQQRILQVHNVLTMYTNKACLHTVIGLRSRYH
jgi:hypothetical protein